MSDLCRDVILRGLRETNPPNLDYINCNKVIFDYPRDVRELFLDKIDKYGHVYVGGLADGAIGIASAISSFSSLYTEDTTYSPFFVRKVEKGGRVIERCFMANPKPSIGSPVVIVDDVLNTGYSIARASKAVEKEWGYKPKLAVVLVDTEVGGKEFLKTKGIECRRIFTAKEILG